MNRYTKATIGVLVIAGLVRLVLLYGNDVGAWLTIIAMLFIARWVLKK